LFNFGSIEYRRLLRPRRATSPATPPGAARTH
jgi:hypothetical protein